MLKRVFPSTIASFNSMADNKLVIQLNKVFKLFSNVLVTDNDSRDLCTSF